MLTHVMCDMWNCVYNERGRCKALLIGVDRERKCSQFCLKKIEPYSSFGMERKRLRNEV